MNINLIYERSNVNNVSYKIRNNHTFIKIFTPRELDCLILVADGFTAKEIGKYLSISPRTVEAYIEKIKTKLYCSRKGQILSKLYALC